MNQKLQDIREGYKEKLDVLEEAGGFGVLENMVEGITELDPEVEGRREAFLASEKHKEKRKKLLLELKALKEMLGKGNSSLEAAEYCQTQAEESKTELDEVLTSALAQTRDLETSYRQLELFFKNSGEEEIPNLVLVNVPFDVIQKNTDVLSAVKKELKSKADRFSLVDNYSLLVVPGYLENHINEWAQAAHKYRTLLITDYKDVKNYKMGLRDAKKNMHSGSEPYLSNAVMTFNYGIVRSKEEGLEEEDLIVPMSAAVAGKMYEGIGVQPAAGYEHGHLFGVLGTRYPLLQSQTTEIENLGFVPIVQESGWNRTVAMSDSTLASKAEDPTLRAYGVVRSLDWIAKILADFFNRRAFRLGGKAEREEVKEKLIAFFESIKGHGNLIQNYELEPPETDPKNPQRMLVNVKIMPFFATKNFIISISGPPGGNNWNAKVSSTDK